MKKLFVAVAAVMVVSATAFSSTNKMTNKGVDEPDTVVVDSNTTQALYDDTVTSDTVIVDTENNTEKIVLAKNDDEVEPDTTTIKKEKVEEVIEKAENKIRFMA